MVELEANIRLRPTRIGFLTSPTDLASVRSIMRACTCVWGGMYNPIIPVFRRAPLEWRSPIKGIDVAKGYARFFEPDVYVESERGLLEAAGLGALRQKHSMHSQVITLREFLSAEKNESWSEPLFGLNIRDVLEHIFKSDKKFTPRDKQESFYVSADRSNALSEALFGVYPNHRDINYLEQDYFDVFRPKKVDPSPDAWRDIYLTGADTPLRVTRFGLDVLRYWYHDLVIFVFDPTSALDLIDLWNLRLEPHPVLPVPLDWFDNLRPQIRKILRAEHRPVSGNPNGVTHSTTIEFARSISQTKAEQLLRAEKDPLPSRTFSVKFWRTSIWLEHRDEHVHRDGRLKVTAEEKTRSLLVKQRHNEFSATFEPLVPSFASRYGPGRCRWVNVVGISDSTNKIASLLPFNTFDRSWPPLAHGREEISVSSEGWVFPQHYVNFPQNVALLSSKDGIVGSLRQFGITARLSDAGQVANQMLEQLDGLWNTELLADIETLTLLNNMAGKLRRKSNDDDIVEEHFGLRTASLPEWDRLIRERSKRRPAPRRSLNDFVKANMIRLGLETDCPHCQAKNWNTLTDLDYQLKCERCLKAYDFPQASLRPKNQHFSYRVIGPFSVPDYGRGSYSVLLTLRVLDHIASMPGDMTYSTAMDLSFDGKEREVDFVAWRSDDRMMRENREPPRLLIGEAKSLGQGELLSARDISHLKSVAAKLPDAVVVISVLRDHFTKREKELLVKFVNWGRRPNTHGKPTNPVLLLTSHELTMDHIISSTWQNLGGVHARFSDFRHTTNLLSFADATQRIYLGLKSFGEVYQESLEKRRTKRKASHDRSTAGTPT